MMAVWGVLFPILTHRPVDPVWEFAVKFAFHTVAFGFCMGIFFWRSREKEYQKPTDDDVA